MSLAAPAAWPGRQHWPALPVLVGLTAAAAGVGGAVVVGFLVAGASSAPLDWVELLTSPTWDPAGGAYGAAAMVFGTVAVSAIALALATPLGWAAAVAITELVAPRRRRLVRGGVELLAAVPSIVYGLVGVALVRPLVSDLAGVPGGDSLLAAGLVLAVMVLPTVVAVSVDALAGVPRATREAAAALGLTRAELVRSVVVPAARPGLRAALLLGLARALGETIAVFLVIGRADGRLPSPAGALAALVRPGQTLTTKLGGPEPVLAGTSGTHWAALSGLGLILLVTVAAVTLVALRGSRRQGVGGGRRLDRAARGWSSRHRRDRLVAVARRGALAVPLVLVAGLVVVLVTRGSAALDPRFWLTAATGADAGGVRDQVAGTVLLVAATGLIAAPVGLGLGLVLGEYAGPRLSGAMRTATVTLGGVPSILLGLAGYRVLGTGLGWGKSWLAGALVLAVVVVPVAALATTARLDTLDPLRRESALALGLHRSQLIRSVLLPHAGPGLATGLLLGLARAAGETAPLLFTATVFSGAAALPAGVVDAPVVALPTHLFALSQDASRPAALEAAWGSALVLVVVAGLLLLAATPARRRLEAAG
ncbi:MAG: ABC transporter permease subunit [Actinobacteria bacterium]|nr:ABC transporter permease subunit [Actinomycetota bacterium]